MLLRICNANSKYSSAVPGFCSYLSFSMSNFERSKIASKFFFCLFRDQKEYWEELSALSDVPRFEMAVMFLSKDAKRGIFTNTCT